MSTKTKKWLKAAGVRAIRTMAQAAMGVIGTSTVISAVDWIVVLSSAVMAGGVSLLMSLAGLPEVTAKTKETESEE